MAGQQGPEKKFNNFKMALKTMSERIIEPSYHSAGMGRTGFGMCEAPDILQRLQTLYGKPNLGDLDAALLHLCVPMVRNQSVEVIIWEIEEVQLLLLSYPDNNMSLPNTALIKYTMIKINKTGIYSESLAHLNAKAETDCIV